MPDETMKAGSELDARLCELLEKKPRHSRVMSIWDAPARSPGGFWIWQAESTILDWRAIPVATDWGAAGKAIDKLTADGQRVEIEIGDYPRARVGNDPLGMYFVGATGTHAFALAACEALERRTEEEE